MKISALVPAYNEARNILRVLEPLRQVAAITEILVISDGCTDETATLAAGLERVKVVSLPHNLGKTQALLRGAMQARYATLLFCDADLMHLQAQHLRDLIDKYCEGFDMVIMDKGGQPWVFKSFLQSVPAVSGTRILDKAHFFSIPFRERDRFQCEIRINDYFLEHGLRIAVTPAESIHDTRKYRKYPFLKGLLLDLKGGLEVLASDGPASIYKNLRMFRKIKSLK